MLDPEVVRLINQEMDGANSVEESRELEKILLGNEEARAYADDLAAAMDHLRNAPVPDPGPYFKTKILAFLQRSDAPEPKFGKKRGFLAPLFEPLKLRYALFFCLGLGLGLLLLLSSKFRLINDSGWNTRQLAGTIMDTGSLSPLETAGWESSGIEQKLDLLRGERMLAVGLRGTADREVVVTIGFSPEEMQFDAVRRLTGETGGVDLLPGTIVLRTSGAHGFLVVFRTQGNPPTSLDVRAVAAGETLFSRSFAWPGGK